MSKVHQAYAKWRREQAHEAAEPHPAAPPVREGPTPSARRRNSQVLEATSVRPDAHLVSLVAPTSFEAEQFRRLRHIVEESHREAGRLAAVAVTSPSEGDGKTLVAINLAGALAQAQQARVLIVDTDLRLPAVCEKLGMAPAPSRGLVDVVRDPRVSLDDVTWYHRRYNLSILPAGSVPETPYEILQSDRMEELLLEVRRQYDYIILDTPPVVAYPDCRVLEKLVDGVLVVVTAHKTPRKLVEAALQELTPEKTLGVVFNALEQRAGYYSSRGHSKHSGGKRSKRSDER